MKTRRLGCPWSKGMIQWRIVTWKNFYFRFFSNTHGIRSSMKGSSAMGRLLIIFFSPKSQLQYFLESSMYKDLILETYTSYPSSSNLFISLDIFTPKDQVKEIKVNQMRVTTCVWARTCPPRCPPGPRASWRLPGPWLADSSMTGSSIGSLFHHHGDYTQYGLRHNTPADFLTQGNLQQGYS